MKGQRKEEFFKAIKEDSPSIKLYKYRNFIQLYPPEALEIKDQMLKFALDNKSVGQYRLIHEALKLKQQDNPLHQSLRAKMIEDSKNLESMKKQFRTENNTQQLAATLLQLGNLYFSYGDYNQCSEALEELSMLKESNHQVKYEDYAGMLALSFYFLNQSFNLSRFNSKPIDKAILKKMPQICIIRDINNIEFRRNMDRPFDNVIKQGITSLEISKNKVMSYNDLGFLYSMVAIAYKKKIDIPNIKWSSKMENLYVNSKYKALLQILKKEKSIKCYLPIFTKLYDLFHKTIVNKVLIQVVSSFDRCPFTMIEEMTGMDEGQVRHLMKVTQDCPLLFDPVTSSVVYKQSAALYKEIKKLYSALQLKYNDEVSIIDRKHDDDEDSEIGPMRRTGSHNRPTRGFADIGFNRRRDF